MTLAKGDPSIQGDAPFTVSEMWPGIDGSYLVKTAPPSFTKEGGIETTVDFYSPVTTSFGILANDATPDVESLVIDSANETPVTASPTSGGVGIA